MKNKVINYLLQEKDIIEEDLYDTLFTQLNSYGYSYKPLTAEELQKIEKCRKQIFDTYKIIDILDKEND